MLFEINIPTDIMPGRGEAGGEDREREVKKKKKEEEK